MKQPDILLFMSDQHGADYCSWGDVKVDTPTLDAIRKTGTVFENTYTSCPLCVPARISFMSSKLPSDTGCYGNQDALPDITPCFTHALVAAGYETVLAGRMHFVGEDRTERNYGTGTLKSYGVSGRTILSDLCRCRVITGNEL